MAFACGWGGADNLPPPVVPQRVGMNIHLIGAPVRDLDGLASGGFDWVRMDFIWEAVEKAKGRYDFSAYDQLLDGAPRSPEALTAFARFAAAAHYKGKPILREIWNEPNGGFWKPSA